MRYYVYALIDPSRDNRVFYIGRGTRRRTANHFAEARAVVGLDTHDVLEEFQHAMPGGTEKARYLADLLARGFTHGAIVRVVARGLDEPLARTVESFLLTFCYAFGSEGLTNLQAGEQADRFRVHGDWATDYLRGERPRGCYVYALRNPRSGALFYVGKGTGTRIDEHFRCARKDGREDVDLGDKINTLRELLKSHDESDIKRVLAHGLTEDEALALEALTLKFIVGHQDATNRVRGHGSGRFRAKGDWLARPGFDLPYVINEGNGAAARQDEMEELLGEGLGEWLQQVAALVPEATWTNLTMCDSADLSLFTTNNCEHPTVSVKLFVRNWKGIQVEARRPGGGTSRVTEDWIAGHCAQLNYQCRRLDRVFFPDGWVRNLANSPDEAARRVRLAMAWLRATSRQELAALVGEVGANELLFVDEALRV